MAFHDSLKPYDFTILYMEDAREWCEYLFDLLQPYDVHQNSEDITVFPTHVITLDAIETSHVRIIIISPTFIERCTKDLERYVVDKRVVGLLCGVKRQELHSLDVRVPSHKQWELIEAQSDAKDLTQVTLKMLLDARKEFDMKALEVTMKALEVTSDNDANNVNIPLAGNVIPQNEEDLYVQETQRERMHYTYSYEPYDFTILYMEDAREWCEYLFDLLQPYDVHQNSEDITVFPTHVITLGAIETSHVRIIIISPTFIERCTKDLERYVAGKRVVGLLCGVKRQELHSLEVRVPSHKQWELIEGQSDAKDLTQVTLRMLLDARKEFDNEGTGSDNDANNVNITLAGNVIPQNEEDLYVQLTQDQITSYDRFLATLSAHLTSSVPAELCDFFHVCDEQKDIIISSQNPGLSLLLVLDEMGIIKSSEVGCLEEPFNKFRLVQALAKINEYKEIVKEENRQLPQTTHHSLEDKRALFVEFLRKKIKSWYETMSPVPWKKSCQWKSTDLFVGSGLILTDSKVKQNVRKIDEQCKLNYTKIFSHEKLKGEIRIILEGDPGAGKTMLSSQLAYDWSEGKIDGVDLLIFLPLKIVENKTLIQAVKDFYIPTNTPLSGNDIRSILASDTERICLLLDGLEEYSTGGRMKANESSEVMKIMKKEKHSNCKVVITCRSDFAHDLPKCPMLKLGRFGETERNSYIEKLSPHNTDKQQKIKTIIQDNPFVLDLCSIPLLFVLAVHNIESMSFSEEGQLNKASLFIRSMILTLCSSSTVKHEVDGIPSKFLGSEKMTLGELAFNGLCKGHQQLSWQKSLTESNVGSLEVWVDSGILVLEEDHVISEKEDQDMSEIKRGEEKKEITMEEKRKGTPDELAVVSEDVVNASMGASKAGHEVSKMEEQHQFVSELETEPHIIKKTVRRAAGHVPLTVKFLHKVIQEWFAATFFCSMMRMFTSEDQFQNYVASQLQHISPTDLHYVLRFTSYLHPPSCHVIMNYLLRSYRKDGSVPPYIMNCVFLCFNEYNDIKGPDMRSVVDDVCKEIITIESEDSRLLQQAKAGLLEYASNEGVIIEKLELRDVIFAVDNTNLTLNSGVQLGILHTVKLIEVSRWDQVLQEDDYKNILKLLSAGKLLKKVWCIFPSQPPDSLDEITLGNMISKDLKVEWHIGQLVQSLDPKMGKWMINFKQPGTSSTKISEVNADPATLSVESTITNDGGSLKIAGTDVQLIVPAGAFKEDRSECLIRLSIIPPGHHDEASTSFSSNSSTIVELLPNNLTLKLPVEVTLPHCLQVKKDTRKKVKILMSHHEGDAQPRWEEVFDHRYVLDDKKCTIWMGRFCWTKYEIDDEIVEAKKIKIYTAAKPIYVPDDIAEIHVGYHLDLPGAGEILRQNPSFIVDQRIPYLFLREGKHPLKVFLSTTSPSTWTYLTPEDNPQEIPFANVASSVEYWCPFILHHHADTTKVPTCIFKASQNEKELKLHIRPKVITTQKQPSGIHSTAECYHQENVTTQAEENDVHSEQLKESPQDASFQLPSIIPSETPDAAVRRKLSLQKNPRERDRYAGSNHKALRQPQEACQNVFQTHGHMSPYHEYQMLPRSGLPSPGPTNPFIQQNYYHQNFSISPYGTPFVGSQSLYEFPYKVNGGGVTLDYSLIKQLGRKLDPPDSLGNNWKELADKLSFTMEDIGVFELAPSSTSAVIECAIKSGKLKSIGQLKAILEQIGRRDASSLLTLSTPEDESEN